MNEWNLIYQSFDPEKEGVREALCTLGNGFFATRGSFSHEKADEVHYPGTYLAGGYNRLTTEVAGRFVENEDLVNMPNWLFLTFRINSGEWFQLKAVETLSFLQELHLKEGFLFRKIHFRDGHGQETTLIERRMVHMKHMHLGAIQWVIKAENWSGLLEIKSELDGDVRNQNVARYRSFHNDHLILLKAQENEEHNVLLKMKTSQSELQVTFCARTKLFREQQQLSLEPQSYMDTRSIGQLFSLEMHQNEEVVVEKVVAFYTSRDHAISECALEAQIAAHDAPSFEELLQTQTMAWEFLWRHCDVGLVLKEKENPFSTSLVLRLHLFHLLQTVSLNTLDLDAGVPARGWHGEAYRGHIFWDELFIFPIFNFRFPKITSALLKYRSRRLERASKAAKLAGHRGALYPWQSGSSGREESQHIHLNPKSGRWIPDNSSLQRHVGLAIAFNFWQHFLITNDFDFLRSYGAEVILEIARFFAGLATFNEKKGRYEILGVMGPDEYHDGYPHATKPGVDNNAYTNVLTVWLLSRALQVLDLIAAEIRADICASLGLCEEEIAHWREVASHMYLPFDDQGILCQFEGYDRLQEFPWEEYRQKYGDIQRLDRILEQEGLECNQFKVSKQADVLMLFYLFSAEELEKLFKTMGYPFDPEMIPRTIDYYLHRTSHGSTLSRVVHSWVLSRVDRSASWNLLRNALQSDLSDIQGGTTSEGIHLGAMAGTVDIVQRCYLGISILDGTLQFNPALPDEVERLRSVLSFRGQLIEMDLTQSELEISVLEGGFKQITIALGGQKYELAGGESRRFPL